MFQSKSTFWFIFFLSFFALPLFVKAFNDVEIADEDYQAITYLYDFEVLNGYKDGSFGGEKTINRAEFLKVLMTIGNFEIDLDLYKDCFTDVTNQWYAPYVCFAKEKNWVEGYEDGSFAPEQEVTRAEGAKILQNALALPILEILENYSDIDSDVLFLK